MARIAFDAMGGDNAPAATVAGAVQALRSHGLRAILVGDESRIVTQLRALDVRDDEFEIVSAGSVVGMDEPPTAALRQKRDSSIVVAAKLVKDGRADALVSAGNSGALMAAGVLVIGRAEGVIRPALGGLLPTANGRLFMLDIGANTDCTVNELVQFAVMGSVYMQRLRSVSNPTVGLLNVGEESMKGNRLYREAHALLDKSTINFAGNVEGMEVLSGSVDVVVCDGFTGNIAIKVMEGVGDFAFGELRKSVDASLIRRAGAVLMRGAFKSLRRKFDYAEWGGAPLLGLKGQVLIGHGRSDARALANGLVTAQAAVDAGLVRKMSSSLRTTPANALQQKGT